MVVNRKSSLRCRDAADERQYMLSGDYEVYEKVGEPVGAVSFHYHDFYELIYIIEGEFSSLIEDRAVRMRKGDFLLIDKMSCTNIIPRRRKWIRPAGSFCGSVIRCCGSWRRESRFLQNASGERGRNCIIPHLL